MEIKEIKNWFEIAVPEPTIENACVQIGVDAEECSELFEAIGDIGAGDMFEVVAGDYKSCTNEMLYLIGRLDEGKKIKVLDALCDKIVTAIGVAHMLGMDIEGALAEVNRSNHSKFEDGKAVFNEQGKIAKGKDYTPPDLARFI
jgi:predicted HAD superfamily Cof-like phosphohydrolase